MSDYRQTHHGIAVCTQCKIKFETNANHEEIECPKCHACETTYTSWPREANDWKLYDPAAAALARKRHAKNPPSKEFMREINRKALQKRWGDR